MSDATREERLEALERIREWRRGSATFHLLPEVVDVLLSEIDLLAQLEAIVRALAEGDPVATLGYPERSDRECTLCEAGVNDEEFTLHGPVPDIPHEQSCAWRLARELIGDSE